MRPEDRKIIITASNILDIIWQASLPSFLYMCVCVFVCVGCQHNIFNFVYILHFYCGVALCILRCFCCF